MPITGVTFPPVYYEDFSRYDSTGTRRRGRDPPPRGTSGSRKERIGRGNREPCPSSYYRQRSPGNSHYRPSGSASPFSRARSPYRRHPALTAPALLSIVIGLIGKDIQGISTTGVAITLAATIMEDARRLDRTGSYFTGVDKKTREASTPNTGTTIRRRWIILAGATPFPASLIFTVPILKKNSREFYSRHDRSLMNPRECRSHSSRAPGNSGDISRLRPYPGDETSAVIVRKGRRLEGRGQLSVK
ncbi:hypothetical protein HOY80DRAFT_1083365 [Tuber brumale]|nr:hypothetical protein HOY80DRAFT_1083365 [Tuber brumale]